MSLIVSVWLSPSSLSLRIAVLGHDVSHSLLLLLFSSSFVVVFVCCFFFFKESEEIQTGECSNRENSSITFFAIPLLLEIKGKRFPCYPLGSIP